MRGSEAMYYGKNGWDKDDEELYIHLDTSDPGTRADMSKIRRESKTESQRLLALP